MKEKHWPATSCTPPTGNVPATNVHALDRNRTWDLSVRRPTLYPLRQTNFGYLYILIIFISRASHISISTVDAHTAVCVTWYACSQSLITEPFYTWNTLLKLDSGTAISIPFSDCAVSLFQQEVNYSTKYFMFCPNPFFNCFGLFSSIWTLLWANLITHFFQIDLTHQWMFCPFTQRLCPTNIHFNSNNSTKIVNKGNLIYKIFLDRAMKTCFILPFKLSDLANKNIVILNFRATKNNFSISISHANAKSIDCLSDIQI